MTIRSNTYSDLSQESAFALATITADTDGSAIDSRSCTELMFVAQVGEATTAPTSANYLELEVEHSDDNSTWTDAADTDIRDAVSGTNTGTFAVINTSALDALCTSAAISGASAMCALWQMSPELWRFRFQPHR